jgi:hypothetical protein
MRSGTRPLSGMGETCNMSSGGVLFATETKIEIGDPIEYEITLSGDGNGASLVRLHCLGKVVRTAERQAEAPEPPCFEVAATLERYEFLRRGL